MYEALDVDLERQGFEVELDIRRGHGIEKIS